MFGTEPASSCSFGKVDVTKVHTYRICTAKEEGDYEGLRYSVRTGLNMAEDDVQVGLGECDVPISIQDVIVSPIPGKYPFRVLTFINNSVALGEAYTAVPVEQD